MTIDICNSLLFSIVLFFRWAKVDRYQMFVCLNTKNWCPWCLDSTAMIVRGGMNRERKGGRSPAAPRKHPYGHTCYGNHVCMMAPFSSVTKLSNPKDGVAKKGDPYESEKKKGEKARSTKRYIEAHTNENRWNSEEAKQDSSKALAMLARRDILKTQTHTHALYCRIHLVSVSRPTSKQTRAGFVGFISVCLKCRDQLSCPGAPFEKFDERYMIAWGNCIYYTISEVKDSKVGQFWYTHTFDSTPIFSSFKITASEFHKYSSELSKFYFSFYIISNYISTYIWNFLL